MKSGVVHVEDTVKSEDIRSFLTMTEHMHELPTYPPLKQFELVTLVLMPDSAHIVFKVRESLSRVETYNHFVVGENLADIQRKIYDLVKEATNILFQ